MKPMPVGNYFSKVEWTGACVDGWIDGEGRATITGGGQIIYIGVFRNGEIQSGSVELGTHIYHGDFKANQPNGSGVLSFGDDTEMRGQFEVGRPEGEMDVRSGGSHYVGKVNPRTLQMKVGARSNTREAVHTKVCFTTNYRRSGNRASSGRHGPQGNVCARLSNRDGNDSMGKRRSV